MVVCKRFELFVAKPSRHGISPPTFASYNCPTTKKLFTGCLGFMLFS